MTTITKKKKVVEKPRLTINKMGEYMEANASRKRTILTNLKYPKETSGFFSFYADARDLIKKYYISNFDTLIMAEGMAEIKSMLTPTISKTKRDNINNSLAILEKVRKFSPPKKLIYSSFTEPNEYLKIEGVSISVYPDLITNSTIRGKDYIGAVKFNLGISNALELKSAQHIACLLQMFVEKSVTSPADVRPDHCISYDANESSFIGCPTAVAKRKTEVSDACKTISVLWDTL